MVRIWDGFRLSKLVGGKKLLITLNTELDFYTLFLTSTSDFIQIGQKLSKFIFWIVLAGVVG